MDGKLEINYDHVSHFDPVPRDDVITICIEPNLEIEQIRKLKEVCDGYRKHARCDS